MADYQFIMLLVVLLLILGRLRGKTPPEPEREAFFEKWEWFQRWNQRAFEKEMERMYGPRRLTLIEKALRWIGGGP